MLFRLQPLLPYPQVKVWDVERQVVGTRMDGHLGWVWNVVPLDGKLVLRISLQYCSGGRLGRAGRVALVLLQLSLPVKLRPF